MPQCNLIDMLILSSTTLALVGLATRAILLPKAQIRPPRHTSSSSSATRLILLFLFKSFDGDGRSSSLSSRSNTRL